MAFFMLTRFALVKYSRADSVYESVFYLMTRAHGLHVIIGNVFLSLLVPFIVLSVS